MYFFNACHVLLRQRHSYHTPKLQCLTFPADNENYIGKSDRNLLKCEHFMDIVNLMRLPDIDSTSTSVVKKEYLLNAVLSNFCILGSCSNWSQLLFWKHFTLRR